MDSCVSERRLVAFTAALLCAGLLASGCGGNSEGYEGGTFSGTEPNEPPDEATVPEPDPEGERLAEVTAEFDRAGEAGGVLYEGSPVANGARAELVILSEENGGSYYAEVEGFPENRLLGARVHTGRCGTSAEDAGPPYRPGGESGQSGGEGGEEDTVFLQMDTDADGRAQAEVPVDRQPEPDAMGSLVFVTDPTDDDGGDPVACMDITSDG
ncbi:hypothetical protein [Nocardiopsis algeriensis]|uniref:Cu-Zn family superoxide dismutase n=1 Tax=Nocardiopsis algeriensis TaxID=1478215 RepID=A0A841ITQ2_9ACTN|nr:hypothetical protein [Nocardiopsis algeriensis]MBB6119631.1 hypothetical protein [Nocardiopsis algeriensis]